MQLKSICPWCGEVESLSNISPTHSWPCVHRPCDIKGCHYIIILNPAACLICNESILCKKPKVFPLKR